MNRYQLLLQALKATNKPVGLPASQFIIFLVKLLTALNSSSLFQLVNRGQVDVTLCRPA